VAATSEGAAAYLAVQGEHCFTSEEAWQVLVVGCRLGFSDISLDISCAPADNKIVEAILLR
jgi:hypothetical protein